MHLALSTDDTWFFKDGRPFSMEHETWATGIFPPMPSTLYGALRALYFNQHPEALNKVGQKDDPSLNIVIKGYYTKVDRGFPMLPAPRDLCVPDDPNVERFALMPLRKRGLGNQALEAFPAFPEPINPRLGWELPESGSFLSLDDYSDYYLTNTPGGLQSIISPPTDFWTPEPRVGIARQPGTRTAAEGKLFRMNMVRPASASRKLELHLEVEGLPDTFPTKGPVKLGAEGKGAWFRVVEEPFWVQPDTSDSPSPSPYFKVYLATPTVFAKGWLPSWIDEKNHTGQFLGEKDGPQVTLIAAALDRARRLGGYNMRGRGANMYKTSHRVVPAGSVYFFRLEEGSWTDIQTLIPIGGRCISEGDHRHTDLARQGFGWAHSILTPNQVPG